MRTTCSIGITKILPSPILPVRRRGDGSVPLPVTDGEDAWAGFIPGEQMPGQPGGYDVIHSHYWQSGWAGTLLARELDLPHVVMFHTLGEVKNRARFGEEEPKLRIRHERTIARRATAIVTASSHERLRSCGRSMGPRARAGHADRLRRHRTGLTHDTTTPNPFLPLLRPADAAPTVQRLL